MNNYILGSHNSWSYLKSKKWWMRPFSFMARCQSKNIKEQYITYGVRCFDLRIRYDELGRLVIAHSLMEYDYDWFFLKMDLTWLDTQGDCYVRILHEARNKRQYKEKSVEAFKSFCQRLTETFPNICFWCGRNLYNWEYDYQFDYAKAPHQSEPTCEEKYSSVCLPKYIDDWFPWIYAKFNNRSIRNQGTNLDILLIDFVNIS